MKFVINFLALLAISAVVYGADTVTKEPVPILSQESEVLADGSYHHSFESGNGIQQQAEGKLKKIDAETSAEVSRGSYSYPGEDGKPVVVEYIADERGFQPSGDSIPKIPELIARALKWIEDHPTPPPKP